MQTVPSTEKSGNEHLLRIAAELISTSNHAVVFTGAGISTHSGIPDFRSPDSGLWNQHDPFEVASIWAFSHHPETFFDWIRPLSITAEAAEPNKAHKAIAELEKQGYVKSVITQNIDGLHQKSGSKKVLELHGSARTATCSHCGKKHEQDYFKRIIIRENGIPQCVNCGKTIKPDVVLFGEALPREVWNEAYHECLLTDLIIVVGSSLEVTPANTLPDMAKRNGAKLIINNLGPTHLDSRADLLLKMDVVEGIGILAEFL
ncbi:MAG TPA: NAD-dependent deacylase [Pelolinea sp.]|nr:NAD-dependent deacylase [Pelolinea sp.]